MTPMAICPICKQGIEKGDAEFPFCSKRCKQIDLGLWVSEKYRIALQSVEPDFEEEEIPPQNVQSDTG